MRGAISAMLRNEIEMDAHSIQRCRISGGGPANCKESSKGDQNIEILCLPSGLNISGVILQQISGQEPKNSKKPMLQWYAYP
jgi:hypothetical protein